MRQVYILVALTLALACSKEKSELTTEPTEAQQPCGVGLGSASDERESDMQKQRKVAGWNGEKVILLRSVTHPPIWCSPAPGDDTIERIPRLATEVEELKRQRADLQQQFAEFQKQFE